MIRFSDGTLSIKVVNTNDLDIELISVHDEKYKSQYQISGIYLQPTGDDVEYIAIEIDNVDNDFADDIGDMYIDYMYDDGNVWTAEIIPFTMHDYDMYNSTDIRIKNNIDEFDFVSITDNTISFIGDDIEISQSMYIPKGYTVIINAGQNINLTNSAYIISYSRIESKGTDLNEVNFCSSDGTGRGLYVCQAPEYSSLEYTSFTNLDTPKSGIWGLTGSVTFYESDVNISNCSFNDNVCEDALNIVRSDFVISTVCFQGHLVMHLMLTSQ